MKIAIQGEVGSFSHEAARRMAPGCTIVPCARSAEVFDRVGRGSVDAAVIPIENSLAGSVTEHFDLLLARKVFIEREFRLRIVHNLIALPGVKRADIRRVYSHPVALEQCRDFFRRNRKIEPVPFYDTAGSVKHVVENRLRDAAGIAGRLLILQVILSNRQPIFALRVRHGGGQQAGDKDTIANETHEIHDVVRIAGKFLAQPRILRGDADRAGI